MCHFLHLSLWVVGAQMTFLAQADSLFGQQQRVHFVQAKDSSQRVQNGPFAPYISPTSFTSLPQCLKVPPLGSASRAIWPNRNFCSDGNVLNLHHLI